MTEYTVTWTIELDAESPADAARQALAIQRDPESIATFFTVRNNEGGTSHDVDLWEIDNEVEHD